MLHVVELIISDIIGLLFLQNASTSGVVLEDFDSSFANKFYHSHLDDPCKFNKYACVQSLWNIINNVIL